MSGNGSNFVSTVVLDAFRKIRKNLEVPGRMVAIEYSGGVASIIVVRRGKLELSYKVVLGSGDANASPVVETKFVDTVSGKEVKSQPESLSRNGTLVTVGEATEADIIESFYEHYRAITTSRHEG